MRTALFIMNFLLLSAFFIISNNNLALIDSNDRQEFFNQYSHWVSTVSGEIKGVTAYVVKVEWLPDTQNEASKDEGSFNVKKVKR